MKTPSQPRGGTRTKNKTSKEQPKNKLENNRQSIATYRSDDTAGAPLMVEVTVTTGRLETLEENQKVTLEASLHFGDDVHSSWGDIAKMEVVSGLPDEEFTQIQKVQATGPGGHAHHRGARQRRADTDCQGIMGGGKRAVETTPCEQEARVKGRQDPRIERKRTRKHGCKGNTERR